MQHTRTNEDEDGATLFFRKLIVNRFQQGEDFVSFRYDGR